MKAMTLALSLTFGVVLVGLIRAEERKVTRDTVAQLAGGYTIVAGEKFGEPEPDARVKGTKVRITDNRIVVTDKDSKETYVASYVLDTKSRPWKITLKSELAPRKDEIAKGLIEKEGDTVRLIYALPGGQAPAEFKTKDKQLMFVLKNVNN